MDDVAPNPEDVDEVRRPQSVPSSRSAVHSMIGGLTLGIGTIYGLAPFKLPISSEKATYSRYQILSRASRLRLLVFTKGFLKPRNNCGDNSSYQLEWRTRTMDIFYEAGHLKDHQGWAEESKYNAGLYPNTTKEEVKFFKHLDIILRQEPEELENEHESNNALHGQPSLERITLQADLSRRAYVMHGKPLEEYMAAPRGKRRGTRAGF